MLEELETLKKNGFEMLPCGVARDEKEAAKIADKIGYPVALKIMAVGVTHKTDAGGVKIGIRTSEALKTAAKDITESARAHNAKISGYFVQKMARKGVELIIGGKKDAQFGHMIILGLGGIYVEVFKDVTARLCPINERDVEEMVEELKSHPIIKGIRGQKGINLGALKKIMLKASTFMIKEDIKELDLNPVIFDDKGCDLVDVRFRK